MAIFFALSLPGLVVIVIFLGILQLLRAKRTGNRRPGAATAGLDLLDLVLKPGSESRIIEAENQKKKVVSASSGADPFENFEALGKQFRWKKR